MFIDQLNQKQCTAIFCFIDKNPDDAAKTLFPEKPDGYKYTGDIKDYCINKFTAYQAITFSTKEVLLKYSDICAGIYIRIPREFRVIPTEVVDDLTPCDRDIHSVECFFCERIKCYYQP